MNKNQKLLEIKNVTKVFKIGGILSKAKLTAIDDVSLSIEADRPVILSIVGESGCGKSTLCKMVLRLLNPDMGEIFLNGRSYADKKGYDSREFRLDVQPIFQNPYETFSMRKQAHSYLFNTALRLRIAKNRAEASDLVDEALKSVGLSLESVYKKYPAQFSGGELQRISIARALITKPKLIIADEPVAAIDASMKMNIINLFKELKEKYKVSFVYITHDLSTAYYVSDYIATLYRGQVIESGRAKDVMDTPAHPYTELLMKAVPRVGDKWDESESESETEDADLNQVIAEKTLENAVISCKFAPRCPYATEECKKAMPTLKNIEGAEHERKVLCFYPRSA